MYIIAAVFFANVIHTFIYNCQIGSNVLIISFYVLIAALGSKICSEQRCLHEVPQSALDAQAYSWHFCRQWDWREHGGVAQGEWSLEHAYDYWWKSF